MPQRAQCRGCFFESSLNPTGLCWSGNSRSPGRHLTGQPFHSAHERQLPVACILTCPGTLPLRLRGSSLLLADLDVIAVKQLHASSDQFDLTCSAIRLDIFHHSFEVSDASAHMAASGQHGLLLGCCISLESFCQCMCHYMKNDVVLIRTSSFVSFAD